MTSPTLILAFDTSGPYCAAALLRDGEVLETRAEQMARGQAERLMPMLKEVLSRAGAIWQDLSAIGVGVGPGNFTGIRISVSAARGLALGLNAPAVGVNGFDARSFDLPEGALPAITAPRDQVYVRPEGAEPSLMPRNEAEKLGPLATDPDPESLALAIARLTEIRWSTTTEPPSPYYIRPADAAPSRDMPPVLLDE